MIDVKDIEKEVKLALKSKVESAIADADVLNLISQYIEPMINEKIELMLNALIANFNQKNKFEGIIEKQFSNKLDTILVEQVKIKIDEVSNAIDMGTAISKKIESYIDTRMKHASLPKDFIPIETIRWTHAAIPADVISKGTIKNFTSTGIQDTAEEVELTVADQVVVIENNLITKNAEVVEDLVANNVKLKTLEIDDKISFSTSAAKDFYKTVQNQIDLSMANLKYDISDRALYANETILINANSLGSSIVTSNLRKLGRLTELNVSGTAQINQTLYVSDNGTIGINTSDPEGAFTVWDEEADLSIKKFKNKTMYIGSYRDTDLFFGINNNIHVTITKDGVLGTNTINLGGIYISVDKNIPNRNGSPGELVLMSNPGENEPWAYRCLGNNKWVAIK